MIDISPSNLNWRESQRPPGEWNPFTVEEPEGMHLRWVRWLIGEAEAEANGNRPRAVNQIEMALRLKKHPSSMARWEQGRDPVPLEIWQAVLFQLARARGLLH